MVNALKQFLIGLGLALGLTTASYAAPPQPVYETTPPFVTGGLVKGSGPQSITKGDLSGDITTSGSMTTLISANAVTTSKVINSAITYAKMQDASAASVLLGRGSTAGAGVFQEITLGTGISLSGTVLSATGAGGTVTSVTSANGDLTVATGTTTPVLTVVSAPKWSSGRTVSITGDLAYTSPSFDGSGNVTAAGTLATVNSNVGSFTYASITVNGKGLITAASSGAAPTGTVTSVTSANGDITVATGTTTPVLTAVSSPKWSTARTLSFTGDVTGSGSVDGSAAVATSLTIASHAVTFAKFNQGATNTVVTNATSGTADFTAFAMPSCSGSANALIWTTNTGFGCQSPVPATSANPFQIGTAYVGSGNGVTGLNCTSITTLTEGSICMRTDVSGLYRMWLPNTLVPTRVQEKSVAASYAMTLTSTPTPGDFLIATCYRYGSLPAANTGWFSKATHNSVGAYDSYIRVVTKLVSVSDTTSQTPCTGTDTNSYSAAVIEVSGLDMVNFNNSLATAVTFQNTSGTGAITATLTYTTTETNNLGVAMFGMTTDNNNNATLMSFNAGWTNSSTAGSNSLTRGSGGAVASQAFPSSSTGVTASGTGGNSVFSVEGLTLVLIMLKQPTSINVGMQQMSDLTTVYSAGVQINPSGTSARSLNFTNGLSATDDGNGAETVSAGAWTGDASISAGAVTVSKTGGVSFGYFATGTDATNLTGSVAAARLTTNLSAAIDSAFTCSARGSVLYRGAANWSCLAPSTSGYSLTTQGAGADPAWTNVGGGGGGGVTQVNTESGWTSGGPITTTGQVTVSSFVKVNAAAHAMSAFGGL